MAVGFVAAISGATSKTTGTTLDLLNVTTVAGNFVVVAIAMDPAAGTVTVSDDAGNTYINDIDVTNGSGTAGVRLVIASSTHTTGLNGTQKIRFTHPSVAARAGGGGRFSGVATSSPKDASSTGTGSTSPWTSGASGTPVQNDELVIGAIGIERLNTDFTTIGTGMTPDQTNIVGPISTTGGSANTNIGFVFQYALQTVATAQTADYTSTTSAVNYAAAVVTYKGVVAATKAPSFFGKFLNRPYRARKVFV